MYSIVILNSVAPTFGLDNVFR